MLISIFPLLSLQPNASLNQILTPVKKKTPPYYPAGLPHDVNVDGFYESGERDIRWEKGHALLDQIPTKLSTRQSLDCIVAAARIDACSHPDLASPYKMSASIAVLITFHTWRLHKRVSSIVIGSSLRKTFGSKHTPKNNTLAPASQVEVEYQPEGNRTHQTRVSFLDRIWERSLAFYYATRILLREPITIRTEYLVNDDSNTVIPHV
jgi:hypothetical protein